MPSAHQDLIDKALQQHELQQQQQQQHHYRHQVAGPSNAAYPSSSSSSVGFGRSRSRTNSNRRPPETIFKTDYDFESLIGVDATVIGPVSGIELTDAYHGYGMAGQRESDEETESIESGMIDEDPNDPEWCEPTGE